MTIRIMLVDDHRLLRETLVVPLNAEKGFSIIAQAENGKDALELLKANKPDVLLLDIGLPDISGIEVAKQAMAIHPDLKIVALSGYADRIFVDEMLKAGARAYVVKSAGIHELILAIRSVIAGHVFLSPEVTSAMLGKSSLRPPASPGATPLNILGKRERDVLRLIASGLRSEQIAKKMSIQATTVDVHRRNIKRKLNLPSVAELTRYAIRNGLIDA